MAIFRYNAEAYENEYERHVGGRESHECPIHVDDECLEGRKYRTTEDGHDKTGTANFHIVTHTAQGNTIDGGEPEHTDSRRIITVDGSDVSSEALAVAQENIRRIRSGKRKA